MNLGQAHQRYQHSQLDRFISEMPLHQTFRRRSPEADPCLCVLKRPRPRLTNRLPADIHPMIGGPTFIQLCGKPALYTERCATLSLSNNVRPVRRVPNPSPVQESLTPATSLSFSNLVPTVSLISFHQCFAHTSAPDLFLQSTSRLAFHHSAHGPQRFRV